MLTKKKKIFILVGMVGLLVVTGWLNIMLNNWTKKNDDTPSGAQLSFFEQMRYDRTERRTQSRLHYEAIVNNPSSSPEAVAEAEASLQALADSILQEGALEGLIMAIGFGDALVTTTTNNLNVIVKAEEITQTQADQILHIISDETDVDLTTVRLTNV